MAVKAMTLVGLDVHARQTHAAVLDQETGEIGVRRLVGERAEVVLFLERMTSVLAVYEAGPTGVRPGEDGGRSRPGCAGRRAGVDP